MRAVGCLIIVFTTLLFSACQKKGENVNDRGKILLSTADTGNAKATFLKLKSASPTVIDSFYSPLLTYLIDSEKFDLLGQHAYYYGQLAGKRNNALALIARSKGWACNYSARYDSSITLFNQAINLYTALNSPRNIADCYYGQGFNYLLTANFAEAFKANYKALGIYEQLADSNNIYKLKTEIGIDHIRQKEYKNAVAILNTCKLYYERQNNRSLTAYCISLISQTYYLQRDFQTALIYAEQALSIRRQLGEKIPLSASLNNVAGIHLALNQWDKAAAEFNESLDYTRAMNDSRPVNIIKTNIANCMWHMGKTKEAQEMLLGVLDSAQQKKELQIITHVYMLLYNFKKTAGDYKEALAYHEEYKKYNDSLFNQEKEKTIDQLNIQYETGKKEAQIARLNSENKIDKAKKLTYLLALALTVIIAAFTISLLGRRNRMNRLAIEKANMELEANARELHRFTESIIAKNKFIEELETRLQHAASQAEETSIKEEHQEQLSKLYQLKILTEEDWLQFKMLFDKVYPGFINRLREHHPGLAPAEERQFLLIKLKIDNKECADMLGISIESVRKNRYRLKKRFNLSESDHLDEFVWGIN